ncbi:protein containing RHS repeat-associated core domain [Levilinea saccharolytica]|nr:protein containing RHS repeat-associated core domain [Levilinea saccharolytica]
MQVGGAASGVQQTTAFGEVRSRGGEMPTAYQYTGQLSQMEEVGLYHYGARWFDPAGAHFTQADTLVPEPQDVLDMAGNVWEWVAYGYWYNYYQDSRAANPTGPGSGET